MKIKFSALIALLVFYLFACSAPKSELGLGKRLFPDTHYLRDGIVNKYYLHFKSNDGYDSTTDIEYQQYLLTKPNELVINKYNPAFELTSSTTYQLSESSMFATQDFKLMRGDTVFSKIDQPELLNWKNKPTYYKSEIKYKTGLTRSIILAREFVKDTIIQNRAAQIVMLKQTIRDSTENNPIKEYDSMVREIYMEGIGLYGYVGHFGKGAGTLELIEQIPGNKFRDLANHSIKRVAYIDPAKKMDKKEDFKICGKMEQIIDYYNADPDAGFIGGKKALWSSILPKIDTNKMHGESGYLTFRFVVNCNGEAGWFITEEADLNYKKKKFNPATAGHLFDIVSNLNNWRPSFLWEQFQDAYVYLTFKLKDGEIIELLP